VQPAQLTEPLQRVLAEPYGTGTEITGLRRESGGASRVTCSFDAVTPEGVRHALILRLGTPGVSAGGPLLREAALMRAAVAAGVPTPEVIAAGGADGPLGAEFVVMARIEGETIPRRVLRSPELADVRPLLAAQCGEILAAIHRIPAAAVPGLDDGDQLGAWRALLEATGRPHPALELAARRLHRDRPSPRRVAVVHGDFRNGNLIIGPDGVRSVLDWELAHLGDPLEDLGWLCVKAWRRLRRLRPARRGLRAGRRRPGGPGRVALVGDVRDPQVGDRVRHAGRAAPVRRGTLDRAGRPRPPGRRERVGSAANAALTPLDPLHRDPP
jgi:aminoglycoside phosphotransferase (APT) family kinase protein